MTLVDTHSRVYSAILSSKYSFSQLYDQDISLIEDADFYRILMSDAGFGAIINVFYAEIAASGVMFQPGGVDKKSAMKARKVASILKKAPIQEAIHGLAKGFIMARAYAYPEGRGIFASHDGGPPRQYWTVTDVKQIDKQRIIFVPKDYPVPDPKWPGQTKNIVKVHREMSNLDTGQYEPLSKEYAAALIEFVCGDEEERLGMGRGLAEALYMLLRAKAMLWKFRLQGISRWAEGLLVGTVDPDRPASPSKSNLSLAQDLLAKLRAMRDGNVIVVPEGLADVKALESSGTGDQMTAEAMNYCDDCAARLLLGSIMPSGGNKKSGTEARGRVEADTTKRVIQYSRHLITACLNRTLVRTVCRLNREQFLEDGCLEGEEPLIKIVDNQATDPETVLDRIEKAQKMKMKVPKAWAHEVSEIPQPSEDEEVLEEVEVAGLTGMGMGGDQSALNGGKEDPGGNGTPFQKTGERQGEKGGSDGANFAAKNDQEEEVTKKDFDKAVASISATYEAKIDRLERKIEDGVVGRRHEPAPSPAPSPMSGTAFDAVVEAAKDLDAKYKAKQEIVERRAAEDRANYEAAMERPIHVHVAAPVVNVAASPIPPAPSVEVSVAAPNVTVTAPVVHVEAAKAPDVTVNNPERRREIMIKRNADGKISGAEVTETATK